MRHICRILANDNKLGAFRKTAGQNLGNVHTNLYSLWSSGDEVIGFDRSPRVYDAISGAGNGPRIDDL